MHWLCNPMGGSGPTHRHVGPTSCWDAAQSKTSHSHVKMSFQINSRHSANQNNLNCRCGKNARTEIHLWVTSTTYSASYSYICSHRATLSQAALNCKILHCTIYNGCLEETKVRKDHKNQHAGYSRSSWSHCDKNRKWEARGNQRRRGGFKKRGRRRNDSTKL